MLIVTSEYLELDALCDGVERVLVWSLNKNISMSW